MRTLATIGLACLLAVSHQLVIADTGTDGQQLRGQDYHDVGGFSSGNTAGSSHPSSSPAMGPQSSLTLLVRRKRDINILGAFDKLNAGTGFLSGILTIFDSLSNKISPDQAMRDGFKGMEDKLNKVSKDIKRIGNKIKKESTWTRYHPDEKVIRNALRALNEYLHEYCRTNGKPYKNQNLEAFFDKAKLIKYSVYNLMSGLIGHTTLGGDILEAIKTDFECHGNKFWAQTEKVMTLINSGLLVYATYSNYKGIPEVTNEHFMETVIEEYAAIKARAESIRDTCKDDESNVVEEMRRIMEDKPDLDNQETAREIWNFLADKYDSRYWFIFVYDGISLFRNHCMSGKFHIAFRVAGKNAAALSVIPGKSLSYNVKKAMAEYDGWLYTRCPLRPTGHILTAGYYTSISIPLTTDCPIRADTLYNFLFEDHGESAHFAVVKHSAHLTWTCHMAMDQIVKFGRDFHAIALPS